MRKILMFIRNGIAATSAARRLVSLVALAAAVVVTLCGVRVSNAQTVAQKPRPVQGYFETSLPTTQPQHFMEGDALDHTMVDGPIVQHSSQPAYSVMETSGYPMGGHGHAGIGSPYQMSNPCNSGCDVSWYISGEALWLSREKDDYFSLSRNTFMPDFDFELGGRLTIGRLLNCVDAWEVVYAGPFDWQRQANVIGTANLQSQFFPSGGYTAAAVSAFNNADQHVQAHRAQMNSFEFNRRWWTWDVVSTMIGVRYVDYEEDYLFLSQNSTVGNGLFTQGLDNQMIGAQVGADILYPVGLRTHVGFKGKAGAYANIENSRTLLQNAGTTIINAGDNNTDLAGLFEIGAFVNYQIVPSIRLTAGYEFWYAPGIAVIPDQSPTQINPSTGTFVSNSDELFLQGGSVGLQILF